MEFEENTNKEFDFMDQNLTFEQRDEFSRKSVGEKVSSLLQSSIDLSPMVIDGGWGKGKTEFCMKVINLMQKSDSHHLIYVDAFKADHSNEPLLTILAEVIKLLPDEGDQESFIEKVVPAIRFGIRTTAKAAVAHLLRQDAADVVDDFDKEIQQVSDKVIDVSVGSLLKEHVKANENLTTLQAALEEISKEKPIVIFIDELDRCRPDFAVDLLEIIKHTLDVEGVKFVLITNTNQLKAAINHSYGHSVDSQRYLDKFLKFTIQLSDSHTENGHEYNAVSVTHYKNLVNGSELLKDSQLGEAGVVSLVERVFRENDVSLREVETLVRHLEVYQNLTNEKGLAKNIIFGYLLLRVLGVLLYSLKPVIAKSIVTDKADALDIGKVLGERELPLLDADYPYPEIPQIVAVMIGSECMLNSDVFAPDGDENVAFWEDNIRDYFRGGSIPRGRGGKLLVVKEVLKTLSLSA